MSNAGSDSSWLVSFRLFSISSFIFRRFAAVGDGDELLVLFIIYSVYFIRCISFY